MSPITGYTSDLPTDVLLDSGVLYVGNQVRGVSRGGLSFDPGVQWRETTFDGKRSPTVGLHRKSGFEPVISGTMLEFGTEELPEYEPGSTSASTGTAGTDQVTTYTPQGADGYVAANSYISNVRLVFERGNGKFAAVLFSKALVRKWSLKGNDNGEADIAIELVACVDLSVVGAKPSDCPYKIELRDALPTA